MSKQICDDEFPWRTPKAKGGVFYKLRVKVPVTHPVPDHTLSRRSDVEEIAAYAG